MSRLCAVLRTPRGAAAAVAVIAVVLGVWGAAGALRTGPGFPALRFPEAEGTASEVAGRVERSLREGTLSRSLAPGAVGEGADALAGAPAIFISAAVDPEDGGGPVRATQRILVTNTSHTELDDVRLHVLAPGAGGSFELASAAVDGRSASSRLEGTTLILEPAGAIVPDTSVLVDLRWILRPRELVESRNPDPADVLNPPKEVTEFVPQLLRRNLLYLFDWYPRPEPLGDEGWQPLRSDPEVADTHGPQGSLMVEIDHPQDWGVVASGARVHSETGDGRGRREYALAGSRAGAVVLQRNTVEREIRKGEFVATGFALDRFGPAVADAAANALYAKAALSRDAGRSRWRQVSVVGLVFAGAAPMFVADDVVFVRQDVLARGAPGWAPNVESSEYRQLTYEGTAAEWWGGAVDVDATSHPFLRSGMRRFAAALVWRSIGGDAATRELTSTQARHYREARSTGSADVPADVATGTYTSPGQETIAASKSMLTPFSIASARDGDGPAAFAAARDFFAAASRQPQLDTSTLSAAAALTGLAPQTSTDLVEQWLRRRDGDATIGTADGTGTIPYWTDRAAAVAAMGNRSEFSIDLDAVSGAGPGW